MFEMHILRKQKCFLWRDMLVINSLYTVRAHANRLFYLLHSLALLPIWLHICSNVLTRRWWQEHELHVRQQPHNTVYWSAVGAPHRQSAKSMWRRLPQTLTRRRTRNAWSVVSVDSMGRLEIQINILVNCERGRTYIITRLPWYREQHSLNRCVCLSFLFSVTLIFPVLSLSSFTFFLSSTILPSSETFIISFFLDGKSCSPYHSIKTHGKFGKTFAHSSPGY